MYKRQALGAGQVFLNAEKALNVLKVQEDFAEPLLSFGLHSSCAVKTPRLALAGMAQWVECQPANQKVTSLIPSQGTCLGCRPGPHLVVCKRQPHIDVSLPLFLPPFPST